MRLREIIDNQVATKQDIAALKQDIAALGSSLQTKLVETKSDIIKWVAGAMLALSGFTISLINFVR